METNSVPVDSNFLPENDAPVNQSSFAMIPMKKGGGVKPLAKNQITNILSAVTGGYNNFSRDQQFQISSLVLQLQDIMTVDQNQSETIPNLSYGLSIEVPRYKCTRNAMQTTCKTNACNSGRCCLKRN